MIAIDTSALIAVLSDEPERPQFQRIISEQERNIISAVSVHEALIVIRIRQGHAGIEKLWALLQTHAIRIAPFDEPQVRGAAAAFCRYGKGIHSRARLNLCDCAAYALAHTLGVPLLYKGDDFSHTDVESAA